MSTQLTNRAKISRKKVLTVSILAIIVVLIGGSIFGVRYYYNENLKPVSQSTHSLTVEVASGSTLASISEQLHDKELIKNRWVFERYVRSRGAQNKLLAGTYSISPSQSVSEIVNILTQGLVESDLVTILPKKTIEEIRSALIVSGFDEQVVDEALKPSNYKAHPALVDKPDGVSLEGYLYPESFHVDSNTSPESIVRLSLDEMAKRLTPEVRKAIA